MKVHEHLAQALLEQHDVMFGIMGDANMDYISSFRDLGGRFVAVAHEAGAVGMADAYSRITGRIGVASVTHGPAFTNTLTTLVEAVRSESRVLLITGATTPEPTHFQRLEIAGVATALGAGYERVYGEDSVIRDLARALQRVLGERRPVVLDLPLDLVHRVAPPQPPMTMPVSPTARVPAEDALDAALGIAAAARRPIILAGRGAVHAGAREALLRVADQVNGLLATTLLAKGYFDGHTRNLGIFGNLSHSVAQSAIEESDCVLAFGASLNLLTTFEGDLLSSDTKIVHVDSDASRIRSYARVDAPVVGDALLTARAMADALEEMNGKQGAPAPSQWVARTEAALAGHTPAHDYRDQSSEGTVDIRTATVRISELLPDDLTVVSDIGRFTVGSWPYLKVTDAEHFITMGAFGSIGLGMAGSIGAAIADPDRLTVGLFGDAGFMMHLSEFTTAVRENLRMLAVVYNDGALGAEYFRLERRGIKPEYGLTSWPSIAEVCRAMGAPTLEVFDLADLDALPALLASSADGPCVLEVRLDPSVNVINW